MSGGRYRLLRLLRRGGMGLLYEAWDARLDRRVAIKTLANRVDPDARHRAVLEAKAATRVRSDHVVQIYDAGEADASGAPYLIMELLTGEDLEAVIRRGPVPAQQAVDWILQACEALAHLGLHGLVHRDIKPSNLFLEQRIDGSLRLKLLDFGVAKDLCRGGSWTNDGQLIGSVPYLAPEQVVDSRGVDARADVWGLGSVLYELIAGRPPFQAEERVIAIAHITQREHVPLERLAPGVPAGLSRVVDRCLEKDRARRWPNIAALAGALEPFASFEGAALVSRVCAICAAEPPQLPVPSAPAESSVSTTLDAPPYPRRALPHSEGGVDWTSLPRADRAEFVVTVHSRAASRAAAVERHGWLQQAARVSGFAGPVAAAAAMALAALWPGTSDSARKRHDRLTQSASECIATYSYYPALGMSHTTGNTRGHYWNLYTNGSVSQVHEFLPGEAELRITAAGDLAGEELPRMIVAVDGQAIGEAEISSEELSVFSFPYSGPGGLHTVQLRFANDYLDDGEDRNLILDQLAIGQCPSPR